MRPAGVGLLLALLAAVGCKGTDPKAAGTKEPAGTPTSRSKGKTPAWLDDSLAKLPGAGTGVPKAGSWADPRDPNFDVAREVKGMIAGRVIDPSGAGAKNVFIRIDPADPAPGEKGGAAQGILANADGYFWTNGLQPGRAYVLSVEQKTADGRTVYGSVQTKPPQPNVTIGLREDLAPPAKGPAGVGLPPVDPLRDGPRGGPPVPDLPKGRAGSDTPLPPPAGLTDDHLPPMGVAPVPPRQPSDGGSRVPPGRPPADGAFTPGFGATSSPVPATIAPPGGTPPTAGPAKPLPPAAESGTPAALPKPENTAAGPPNPTRPPVLNIPGPPSSPAGPPVPALPTLPPTAPPAGDGKKSLRPVRPGADFALVDALDRPWDLATGRTAPVVLVDFMTTSCPPCKRSVPGLVDLQARYAAAGLELVGVVCDDGPARDRLAAADRYHRDHGLNYALYVEPRPGAVQAKFGVSAYPTAVLLDEEGNQVWKGNPLSDHAALEAAVRRQLGK